MTTAPLPTNGPRDTIYLTDLVTGMVCCLAIRGYEEFPLGRRTEDAVVYAGRPFIESARRGGHDVWFTLHSNQMHGGSGDVRYAFAELMTRAVAYRPLTEPVMRFDLNQATAAALLAHLPGDAQWYRDFTVEFRRLLEGDGRSWQAALMRQAEREAALRARRQASRGAAL